MDTRRGLLPVIVVGVLALVTASCGAPGNDLETTGLIAFREAGCAACHGQNAEGGIGPAMGGHAAEQVVRQVRAPLGAMPLFTVGELSDEQLDAIVKFVVGLEPADHGHGDTTTLDPREVLAGHHWMALSSMLVGNIAEATHHVEDITDVVTGEHLTAMEEILAFLDAGDLEAAAEMTTEMLARSVPEAGAIDELHLRLALQALAVDDPTEASGHLERVGDGAFADAAQEVLEAVEAGEKHDATELLLDALGEADHDEDDDHVDG